MKLTFNIDLTEFDTKDYEKNPIVVANFDYHSPPIGRAVIAEDKKSVTVELPPKGLNIMSDIVADYPIEQMQLSAGYDKLSRKLFCTSIGMKRG